MGSCAARLPMTSDYYKNAKKVGAVYVIDSLGVYKGGAQGLLDMALTPGNKYKKVVNAIEGKFDPKPKIKKLYQDIFTSKGKSLNEIDFTYNPDSLEKFDEPASKKKYHTYDLRFLKEKGIDELLLVKVIYGLNISYYGVVEIGKMGTCYIYSEIVNLDDNSIIYKDHSHYEEYIKGKWNTPPDYELITNSIKTAIDKTLAIEKERLDK